MALRPFRWLRSLAVWTCWVPQDLQRRIEAFCQLGIAAFIFALVLSPRRDFVIAHFPALVDFDYLYVLQDARRVDAEALARRRVAVRVEAG